MLGGMTVDAARMRRTSTMTGGLIVAEAVMMGLAPHLGRQAAHDLVYDACRVAIGEKRTLFDVLSAEPKVSAALDEAKLKALCDPANYLGMAREMVDLVLAAKTGSAQ